MLIVKKELLLKTFTYNIGVKAVSPCSRKNLNVHILTNLCYIKIRHEAPLQYENKTLRYVYLMYMYVNIFEL